MKKGAIFFVLLIIVALGFIYLRSKNSGFINKPPAANPPKASTNQEDVPVVSVIAENFDTPWGIAFLPATASGGPDNNILVTEREGSVKLVDASKNNEVSEIAKYRIQKK